MSQSLYIEYGENGFWTYTQNACVLLKFLLDQAVEHETHSPSAWLKISIEHWQADAISGEFGFFLDPEWPEDQLQIVKTLIAHSRQKLAKSDSISDEEAESWRVIDGYGIRLNGESPITVAPILDLADAILEMLTGELPAPPQNTWWGIGYPGDGRIVVKKRYS